MKPIVSNDTMTRSTTQGERVGLTVDASNMAHIMSLLTEIYERADLAVIREYSTNALDAHRAAGNSEPIAVSLPSAFNPVFVVEDWGVGLSADDLRNIYSKYGLSTKRETNEETGMLGIGCKSALAYTSQFSISAVKDGVLTHAVVSRVETGEGVLEIVNTQPTSKPNGVTINVPVNDDIDSFNRTAKEFFKFWTPGNVLVDGEDVSLDYTEIDDNTWIDADTTSHYGTKSLTIVQGEIPYGVDMDAVFGRYNSSNLLVPTILRVPIGSVSFSPSREGLIYNDATKTFIMNAIDSINGKVKAFFTEKFKQIKNYKELNHALRGVDTYWLENLGLTVMGQKFTRYITLPDDARVYYQHRSRNRMSRKGTYFYVHEVNQSAIINGCPESISAYKSQKLSKFLEEQEVTASNIILAESPLGDRFDDIESYDWADVEAIKITREYKERKKSSGHTIITRNGYLYEQDIEEDEEVLYVWRKRWEDDGGSAADISTVFGPDTKVVLLNKNQIDKFKREHENARSMSDAYSELSDVKSDEREWMSAKWWELNEFPKHDCVFIDEIEDAELVAAIKAIASAKRGGDYGDLRRSHNRIASFVGAESKYRLTAPSWYDTLEKYPLARHFGRGMKRHNTDYLNWVYNTNKEDSDV